jgi:hypothetical protein
MATSYVSLARWRELLCLTEWVTRLSDKKKRKGYWLGHGTYLSVSGSLRSGPFDSNAGRHFLHS